MVINLSNECSLICDWISEIRDVQIQSDRMRFRRNLERIGEIAAYEISRTLVYEEKEVQTPLGISPSKVLKEQPVLATILRAGLPLHQGLLNYGLPQTPARWQLRDQPRLYFLSRAREQGGDHF
jgi:uracil phosphoribosyltransferase